MLDKYIENDDPAKVRKSLLTISLATLFIANVQFSTNQLSFFGLQVVIDSARLVAFGRIASGVLLVVFFLRSLSQILNSIKEIWNRRLGNLERVWRENLNASWGLDVPSEPEEGPAGEFQYLEEKVGYRQRRIEAFFERVNFWVSAFVFLCLDYALPLFAGVVAARFPYSFADIVTKVAASANAS